MLCDCCSESGKELLFVVLERGKFGKKGFNPSVFKGGDLVASCR